MAKGFIYSITTEWTCPRCRVNKCEVGTLCASCMSIITPEEFKEWKQKVVGLRGQETQARQGD